MGGSAAVYAPLMAKLTGEIMQLARNELGEHAVGATVVVSHNGSVVASGQIDREDRFEIELPAGLVGELEVTVGTEGFAPSLVEADGQDLFITLMYNAGSNYF